MGLSNKIKSAFIFFKSNIIANRLANVLSIDFIVKGSNLLLVPVYLHLMSQDQVGSFNYIFAFIQTISVILNFGVPIAQSKLYHDYKGVQLNQLLFTINLILVGSLLLILVPAYIFKFDILLAKIIFDKHMVYLQYRFIILFAIIVTIASYVLFNYLLTSENIRKVQRYNLLRLFLSNTIVILLLKYYSIDKVLLRLTSFYFIEFSIYLLFAIKYFAKFKICFNIDIIKRVLFFSFPTFLLTIVSNIQAFSDKLFIQQKSDLSVLAVYTLGTTIAAVFGLIIQSFQSVWLPIFFKEKDLKKNFRITRKTTKVIIIVFAIMSLFLYLGVKIALVWNIIPENYKQVLSILPFLFLSQVIVGVNMMYSNYFSYFNKVYLGAIIGSCVYVINFGLNYYFILNYGVNGALISMLLGNVLLLFVVYIFVSKLYQKNLQLYPHNKFME